MISKPIARPVVTGSLASRKSVWPWGRLRLQLGGALLLAIVAPLLWWLFLVDQTELNGPTMQTLVGSTVALVAGCWQFRAINQFPGVGASANIVSSFALSFGAAMAVFFVSRLEYIRPLFLLAFAISIGWFYVTHVLAQRQRRLVIGVVPFGEVHRFAEIEGISWSPLSLPRMDMRHVDAVVADFSAELPDDWERAIAEWSIAGIPVLARKHLLESLTGEVEIEHLSENQFGTLVPASTYLKAKGALDWMVALLSLPLLLPVLALIAVVVRLDSAGPALFRQQRMGFRGRPFTVYKFRTMACRGHEEDASPRDAAITQQDDARVTRIGRWLRKSRLDELPQVINILRGQMSWIGPRPEAVPLASWYEAELPFYRYRHIVRPGITGWAQVNQGHVADVEAVQKKLNYDFYYIKYFSPGLDMLIVARTVRTMLTGFGSR